MRDTREPINVLVMAMIRTFGFLFLFYLGRDFIYGNYFDLWAAILAPIVFFYVFANPRVDDIR